MDPLKGGNLRERLHSFGEFFRSLGTPPFVGFLSDDFWQQFRLLICPCLKLNMDITLLSVGIELLRETLPLQGGCRLYELQGLKPSLWYEVKISYPASIPSSFSMELRRDKKKQSLKNGRKLLNTEKLIFEAGSHVLEIPGETKIFVLVSIQPEGIVAKPNAQERQFAMFNIVCDELSFGIPHNAWPVGILVILCIAFAFVIPRFLPSGLLSEQSGSVLGSSATKAL
ncbi:uncharacterized protein LOC18431564 isoform X1 [Amborella trichopoda]|uniref:uncharacterized protein LOC18431564 isoform X1 n=2 Tax=Amborella trichopoda TaxID=13333 RepID=UPI0009BDDD00|nr:uncharacterized protein LOC18431564 isoform X1 [Amborella trichopoda]|eukprot:XP_020521237.1 uncharacterized protein LOC18431564 isoform X1 [Amborella trichopoda]